MIGPIPPPPPPPGLPPVNINLNAGAQMIDPGQVNARNKAAAQKEGEYAQSKDLITKLLTTLVEGRGQGRMYAPAYNMHEYNGMGGISDPAMLGQGTNLPLPFDPQFDSTANLLGVINSLGPERYNASQAIIRQADSQLPSMKNALRTPYTIYEQYPSNYYVNRLNIELQRKRENSMYSFV